MSLVAYGSSDESEDEEQEIPEVNAKQSNDNKVENVPSQQPFTEQKNSEDGDKKLSDKNTNINNNVKTSDFFSSIPPPKSNTLPTTDATKINDKSIKKSIVKISVPSLSDFKDDDVEPTKKKLKPSAKGSGLFAILPAPRNVFLKNTKSLDGSKTQAPLVPRSISKPPMKPPVVIPKRFLKPDEDSIPEENNEGPLDFFSLSSLNDVPDDDSVDTMIELGGSTSSSLNLPPPLSWGHSPSELHSSKSPTSKTSEASSSDSVSADTESDFIPVDNGNIQLSEEALQKLCGRRATRQQQELEVIDVCGASLLPDPNEWLTKQLTEEKQLPSRGFGHRRHDGPTSQQRRKHQITYLAFQAKENELELKNQWSHNRMSRKQTQSKYGF